MTTPEWQRLRETTIGDQVAAGVGSQAFVEETLAALPEEVKKQAREQASAQAEALAARKLEQGLAEGTSVLGFSDALGLRNGVSGYSYHSVPVALYAWMRSPNDFREALTPALNCGGDTDTVGAIVGALAGASVGTRGIPSEWLSRICEWPRSLKVLGQAAERLAHQKLGASALGPIKYFWLGLVPRNLAFLLIVLTHGFRRLGPPY